MSVANSDIYGYLSPNSDINGSVADFVNERDDAADENIYENDHEETGSEHIYENEDENSGLSVFYRHRSEEADRSWPMGQKYKIRLSPRLNISIINLTDGAINS